MDKYFTISDLLAHSVKDVLKQQEHSAESSKICPLQEFEEMKKKVLGTYDYRFEDENGIMIVEWVDNKCVMFSKTLANW